MAKVKYDVKGVEGSGNFEAPTPGVYTAKVHQADVNKPADKDRRIEVIYEITEGDFKGARIYDYVNLESEGAKFRLADFIRALGLKDAGTLDTDKILGEEVQVRVRNETYPPGPDGERRAKIAQVLPLGDDDGSDDEDLDDDDADGDDDDEDQDYNTMELAELREECDDRGLSSKGSKKALIARLEADDAEGDDDDEDDDDEDEDAPGTDDEGDGDDDDEDYNEWSVDDLKAELESRGLKTAGRKSALVARLTADDEE